MKRYKLIVLDLDGTLTNQQKEITPYTYQRLMAAQQAGVKVVLASGRPTMGIQALAEQLELGRYGGYILSYNGGQIIDCASNNIVYESLLPQHTIPHLYEVATQNDLAIVTYKDRNIVTEYIDSYVEKEAFLNKMEVHQVDNFVETVTFPVTKCLIVGDSEKIASLEPKLQKEWEGILNIYRSEPYFLELMPPAIDKAYSLSRLLDYLEMEKEEMIACGDGFNDLSMIRFAGLGVAMQNAQAAVKEVADYITLSNEEDGVAHVIDTFILN